MHTALLDILISRPSETSPTPQLHADASQLQLAQESQVDHQFMGMLDSYRISGGVARAQEVFTMYKSQPLADVAILARWIVQRNIISFDWQSTVWIPLFQFDRLTMTPRAGLQAVLAVLNPVLGPWEIAMWFTQPNPWLSGRTPANTLGTDAAAAVGGASADCFIVAG